MCPQRTASWIDSSSLRFMPRKAMRTRPSRDIGRGPPGGAASRFPSSRALDLRVQRLERHRHTPGDEAGGSKRAGDGGERQERDPQRVMQHVGRQACRRPRSAGSTRRPGNRHREHPAVPSSREAPAMMERRAARRRSRRRVDLSTTGPLVGIEPVARVSKTKADTAEPRRMSSSPNRVSQYCSTSTTPWVNRSATWNVEARHLPLVLDDDRRFFQERIHVGGEDHASTVGADDPRVPRLARHVALDEPVGAPGADHCPAGRRRRAARGPVGPRTVSQISIRLPRFPAWQSLPGGCRCVRSGGDA